MRMLKIMQISADVDADIRSTSNHKCLIFFVPFFTGAHQQSMDDCEKLYRKLSTQIFTQTTFQGAKGLFMKSSYYDSDAWTDILKENMGESSLIETSRDLDSCKVRLIDFMFFFSSLFIFIIKKIHLFAIKKQ